MTLNSTPQRFYKIYLLARAGPIRTMGRTPFQRKEPLMILQILESRGNVQLPRGLLKKMKERRSQGHVTRVKRKVTFSNSTYRRNIASSKDFLTDKTLGKS
jgi:hypothetical protein